MTMLVNRPKQALTHPLFLCISVWLLCFLLYALHLSELLIFSTGEVWRMVCWIVAPFIAANLLFSVFYAISPKTPVHIEKDIDDETYLKKVESRLQWWFRCWIILSAIEVVSSGGLPVVWLITRNPKAYSEFGLPFIHVFISSLLSVISLAKLGLYLLRGDRRRLLIPIFQVLWSFVIVSRGVMIVALIQGVVLWICLRGVRIKTLFRATALFTATLLLFGYIGDFRSGSTSFRDLARPSADYPTWLPSGALWFYVYITTPLGNLVNTSYSSPPSYNILFPSTTYFLFPTPIRNAIYGKDSNLGGSGDLVDEVFNVSSAYVGPFKDFGYAGIACFSLLLGTISAYYWKQRKSFRDQLLYSIVAQCVLLTIFWNFLFYNPFLGQVFWIYFLFRHSTFKVFPRLQRSLIYFRAVEQGGVVTRSNRPEAQDV